MSHNAHHAHVLIFFAEIICSYIIVFFLTWDCKVDEDVPAEDPDVQGEPEVEEGAHEEVVVDDHDLGPHRPRPY